MHWVQLRMAKYLGQIDHSCLPLTWSEPSLFLEVTKLVSCVYEVQNSWVDTLARLGSIPKKLTVVTCLEPINEPEEDGVQWRENTGVEIHGV